MNNSPALYATEQVNTTTKTHHQYEAQNTGGQKEAGIEQYHKEAGNNQENGTAIIYEKSNPAQVNKSIRTRSGCIVKKQDRLAYV